MATETPIDFRMLNTLASILQSTVEEQFVNTAYNITKFLREFETIAAWPPKLFEQQIHTPINKHLDKIENLLNQVGDLTEQLHQLQSISTLENKVNDLERQVSSLAEENSKRNGNLPKLVNQHHETLSALERRIAKLEFSEANNLEVPPDQDYLG